MRGLKCFGKYKDQIIVPNQMRDKQEFQDWIFLIHGHDELLQICSRHLKADATDAISLLESEDCSLFIFYGDVASIKIIIDDERKGG